jgi:hypothetical protein
MDTNLSSTADNLNNAANEVVQENPNLAEVL